MECRCSICCTPRYEESFWDHHEYGKRSYLLSKQEAEAQHKKLNRSRASGSRRCHGTGLIDQEFPHRARIQIQTNGYPTRRAHTIYIYIHEYTKSTSHQNSESAQKQRGTTPSLFVTTKTTTKATYTHHGHPRRTIPAPSQHH